MTNTTRIPEITWKSICPSLRMKTGRMLSPYQSWHWDIMVYHQAGCQDCTLFPYVIHSLQGYPGSWWGTWAPISLWMVWSLCWMSTTTMSRLWTPQTRNFSNYKWLTKKQCQIWGCASQDTPKSLCLHSQKGSCQTMLVNWSETASTVDSPSSWRWWWPTSRQLLIRRHTQTTIEWCKNQRSRRQYKLSCRSATTNISKLKVTSFFPLQKLKGCKPNQNPLCKGDAPQRKKSANKEGMWTVKTKMASKA